MLEIMIVNFLCFCIFVLVTNSTNIKKCDMYDVMVQEGRESLQDWQPMFFYISRAWSYLSDDPETCVNCHIMAPQYATWAHSAHRNYTDCNACHVPHDNIFNHYIFKAKDGLRHATVFTLRNEPQVIFIKDAGRQVVQENCIRCHENVINDFKLRTVTQDFHDHRTDRTCWDCHRTTPHGRVNSLSSAPNAMVPLPESPVPDWLKDIN